MFKNLFFGASAAILMLSSSFVMAQSDRMDEMKLWSLRRLTETQISPDGATVLYAVRSPDIAANKSTAEVFTQPTKGGERKLVLDKTISAMSIKFRPDGKKIAYLSYQNKAVRLFECDLDGTNHKEVSNNPGIDIDGFAYSPDMKHVAYFTQVKVDKDIHDLYPDLPKTSGKIIDGLNYRHWDTWEDGLYSHIFVAPYDAANSFANILEKSTDLMQGEAFDAPNPPNDGEEAMTWSRDGRFLLYSCKKERGTAYAISTNTDIYCYNIKTTKTFNLTAPALGYDNHPTFSPDGKHLAWLSMERAGYESDKERIMTAAFNDGFLSGITEATKSIDRSAAAYTWATDSKTLYGILIDKGTKQIYKFEMSGKTAVALTEGQHDFGSVACIKIDNKDALLAQRNSMSAPVDLYTVNLTSKTPAASATQFTFVNKDVLDKMMLGNVKPRTVKTTDGKDMLAWVIYPPDFDPNKKYPTLLFCQGGPQSPVSQFWSYRWNFQMMAAKGYIIIAPNRRGLQGFGQAWNDAIQGDYGGQCMKDYLSAVDDIAKEPYVDKDRLGAVGASFGGYSVYWLAGNHQKRFKAFISHCGMFNMESWYGTTEEMFFANSDQKGPYWDNPAPYKAGSPHLFVKNWDTPILVIHNEKDFRVPLGEGMQAFTAAQIKKIPSRFLYFPDEHHHVLKPQNGVLWQRVFFEWLDTHLAAKQ
jgi:dipeptidyl aminopeptidase/acylaminoacyl peptidase